jgi:hypothetical protein
MLPAVLVRLTDAQLSVLVTAAIPLLVEDRDAFLRDIAGVLCDRRHEMGDGEFWRLVKAIQLRHHPRPDMGWGESRGHAGRITREASYRPAARR